MLSCSLNKRRSALSRGLVLTFCNRTVQNPNPRYLYTTRFASPISVSTIQISIRFSVSTMKRTMPWSDDDSSDKSSSSHSDSENEDSAGKKKSKNSTITSQRSNDKASQVKSGRPKGPAVDFESLKRYGYKGGPSILNMPPPKENEKEQDWSWSSGKETRQQETEESYEDRQKTRAALAVAEEMVSIQTQKEKKNLSFSQKEKKKRELGQASRGKNYVEEEKRLLRDSGIYSGFDA